MSPYATELDFLLGVSGIMLVFILMCIQDGDNLEAQLLEHWQGEMASKFYFTPIKKVTSNPFVGLLLDAVLGAICIATLGLGGGIVALVIIFALEKNVFAKIALRHNLQKALEENKYGTKISRDDSFANIASATIRIQLKFLIEHPKSALLIATMNPRTADKYRDGLFVLGLNDTMADDEKIFVYFLNYPNTAEGQKLIKKEIEAAKKRHSMVRNKDRRRDK